MTQPEALLWQALRARPEAIKFRRQHPIGRFVVDFYCPSAKLVIEVDGAVHEMGDRQERDAARDLWLRERGYRVLRLPAFEVGHDLESAIRLILLKCRA